MPITQNLGAATKANVKATPGRVLSILATNSNAALRWLLLHDKATAPAATDVPIIAIPLPAGSAAAPSVQKHADELFGASGQSFAAGIGWSVSTTPGTFTDSATAAEHTVLVRWQ